MLEDREDWVHVVNESLDWQLSETAGGMLTDGRVSEDLQRDIVHQIVQWLRHFPERLQQMEALTSLGREALRQARAMDLGDGQMRG